MSEAIDVHVFLQWKLVLMCFCKSSLSSFYLRENCFISTDCI